MRIEFDLRRRGRDHGDIGAVADLDSVFAGVVALGGFLLEARVIGAAPVDPALLGGGTAPIGDAVARDAGIGIDRSRERAVRPGRHRDRRAETLLRVGDGGVGGLRRGGQEKERERRRHGGGFPGRMPANVPRGRGAIKRFASRRG